MQPRAWCRSSACTLKALQLMSQKSQGCTSMQLIRQAYRLRQDTPSSMLPDPEALRPLPAEVGHYPVFSAFPRAAVQAQVSGMGAPHTSTAREPQTGMGHCFLAQLLSLSCDLGASGDAKMHTVLSLRQQGSSGL